MFIYLKPSLFLSFLFFAFCQLGADSNSSKNSEEIEKKPLNTKNKDAEKTSEKKIEKPETISPEKKNIRNTITLKGYMEDPDAIALSIDTLNWTELRVSSPPKHGADVKKGEVIMELDTEKIRNHIQVLTHDLNILDLNKEILQAEIKLAEELAPIEKAEMDRFENYVKEDYNRYKEIYLPFDKKSAAMNLKSSEQYLAYAAEELNQLKKMYEADDLTEETEEIILQRAQNQYDRAKFSLEAAKIRNEDLLKIQLPRGQVATDTNFNREKLSIETLRRIKPAELNRKKLEGKKLVEDRKQFAINKAKFEKDMRMMTPLKSPSNGILFWGTFDRGKWSGKASYNTKLRKGGLLKSHEDFITVCPGKKIIARMNLPEKHLHQVKIGNKAEITLVSSDDLKIPSSIKTISRTPAQPGTYDLTAEILLPKGVIMPVPGTACSLECVTYERDDAITLPNSVIHSDESKAESKYVYILNKKGNPIRKNIEVGKKSGDSVEIISGIRMGMKVLKNKPTS